MSVDKSKATPRPWHWEWTDEYTGGFGESAELHGNGKRLLYADVAGIVSGVKLCSDAEPEEAQANAALIIDAINSYDRLKQIEEKAVELANTVVAAHDARFVNGTVATAVEKEGQAHQQARELLKLAGKE